jgi:hypothetical protein
MEHGVLGVTRPIRQSGSQHPPGYREQGALPMPKNRYRAAPGVLAVFDRGQDRRARLSDVARRVSSARALGAARADDHHLAAELPDRHDDPEQSPHWRRLAEEREELRKRSILAPDGFLLIQVSTVPSETKRSS